ISYFRDSSRSKRQFKRVSKYPRD
ncbi:uncharacterized protein METZ01_LOCUS477400, partial [marine metagenome]